MMKAPCCNRVSGVQVSACRLRRGHRAAPDRLRPRAALVENEVGKPKSSAPKSNGAEAEKEEDFDDAYSISTLTMDQVQELVTIVSEETELAEVHVKLSDMEVRFRRTAGDVPVPAALPPPPPPQQAAPPPPPMGHAPLPMSERAMESVDAGSEDFDGGNNLATVPVPCKKVGILHRCRFIGKRQVGKTPIVTAGSVVRNKQPLAFIEQLGTYSAVEAPMDGVIVNVLVEDKSPVEFDQAAFEMQPEMASSGSRIK